MSEEGEVGNNEAKEAENTADGGQVPSPDVPSTSPPPPREKMIETAIKFLVNPQVRSSPLTQKKGFLQRKGLTAQEIEIAVDRSGSKVDIPAAAATQPPPTAGVVPPYQNQPHGGGPPYGQQMVPVLPPKSRYEMVRDYAAMAVVVSGVSFGFYKLYEKFLQPLLASHREEKVRQERLEQSITELSTSVRGAVEEMQKSLTSLNTLVEQQQAKFDQLTLDMSTNKSVIATNRSSNTAEIKSEIQSLKGLLLNRHQFPATPQPPAIPEWQRAPPVNQEATPTKQEATPTKQEATPTNQEATPTNQEATPTHEEATPTKAPPANQQQTTPAPNPPITASSRDEVDRTPNGHALNSNNSSSAGAESVNHDDESDNESDVEGGSSVDGGQGKSGRSGSGDNLNGSVNQMNGELTVNGDS